MKRRYLRHQWMVTVLQAMALVVLCSGASRLFADISYGSASDIGTFFDGASVFLIKTLGGGVSVVGLIWAGVKIASGDHQGLLNAFLTITGGAIIFLSKSIIGALMQWTNVH